jgi:hypothetical protein
VKKPVHSRNFFAWKFDTKVSNIFFFACFRHCLKLWLTSKFWLDNSKVNPRLKYRAYVYFSAQLRVKVSNNFFLMLVVLSAAIFEKVVASRSGQA